MVIVCLEWDKTLDKCQWTTDSVVPVNTPSNMCQAMTGGV
jgi:hypothetical protein